MNQEPLSLTSLIDAWIKDHPKLKDHYEVVGNSIAGVPLDWVQCKCKRSGELPPTPKYDMIISENTISIWDMQRQQEEVTLTPHDKDLFTKLEAYLEHSHDIPFSH